jgi:hypothetical protein
LIYDRGINGKVIDWLDELTAECPKKIARNMNDPMRCAVSEFAEGVLRETMMGEDDVKPTEAAVKNWLLLETEIKNVLKEDKWQIVENRLGNACIFPGDNDGRELNITRLAKVLAGSHRWISAHCSSISCSSINAPPGPSMRMAL